MEVAGTLTDTTGTHITGTHKALREQGVGKPGGKPGGIEFSSTRVDEHGVGGRGQGH